MASLIDPVEEKKVLRKIDRVVMPLMFVVFFFQCRYTAQYIAIWATS